MAVDSTDYNIAFRAPALPIPPAAYDQRHSDETNNVLRLYFNQLDQALRSSRSTDQAESVAWFLS
jgi:hypothetical protein